MNSGVCGGSAGEEPDEVKPGDLAVTPAGVRAAAGADNLDKSTEQVFFIIATEGR